MIIGHALRTCEKGPAASLDARSTPRSSVGVGASLKVGPVACLSTSTHRLKVRTGKVDECQADTRFGLQDVDMLSRV